MPKILFVCTGNTCRSPMAQALFRKLVRERASHPDEWMVASAGIGALDGNSIAPHALAVLRDHFGVDAADYQSVSVSPGLLGEQSLILVMERRHKERVAEIAPEVGGRVFTLREFCREPRVDGRASGASGPDDPDPGDVPDPFGRSIESYREVAEEIQGLLDRGWPRLRSWGWTDE